MMKTQPDIRSLNVEPAEPQASFLLSKTQAMITAALLLIATGVAFTLVYAGQISWSDPWWVIYVAIPSLMLLVAAGSALVQGDKGVRYASGNAILGLIGVAVSIIMVVDPTWSFTQAWRFDETFPFLRNVRWDPVWQWALVVLGAVSVVMALLRRAVGIGVIGVILMMVGGTFLLELSWDKVWPLLLVVLGTGLLFQIVRK